MPTRDTAPTGAPCWVDLSTNDAARSREFYPSLLGWTALEASPEFGGYFMFTKDGVPVAGCMPSEPGAGMPDAWSIYLAADDIQKAVDTATSLGAQVIAPAMAVADLGTMAILSDPGGAVVGIWQANTFHGFGVLGEHGTPSWFELHTRDYDTSLSFYTETFRWDVHSVSDSPEFRYSTHNQGADQLAGVMDASAFLPEGVPAHWSVYFGVDDADAALAKVVELGGSVVLPAEDTPYGRLATAADPNGAHFKVVAPNAEMPAASSTG